MRPWLLSAMVAAASCDRAPDRLDVDFLLQELQDVWEPERLLSYRRLASATLELQDRLVGAVYAQGWEVSGCARLRSNPLFRHSCVRNAGLCRHGEGFPAWSASSGRELGPCLLPPALAALGGPSWPEALGPAFLGGGVPAELLDSIDVAVTAALRDVSQLELCKDGNSQTGDVESDSIGCVKAYTATQALGSAVASWIWREYYAVAQRRGLIPEDCLVEASPVRPALAKHTVLALLRDVLRRSQDREGEPAEGEPGKPVMVRAVEVGVYQAQSSLFWLHEVEELELLLVDPFAQTEELSGGKYEEIYLSDPDADFASVSQRLRPYGARAALLRWPSLQAASWVADRSVDLVFLDGDHSAGSVAADIAAWAPKVRPGGYVAGHDYTPFHLWEHGQTRRAVSPEEATRTVAAVVNSLLPAGCRLHLAADALWYWQVPA